MAAKNILICNERVLQRFGVDRILLTLAPALQKNGWNVEFLCCRADDYVKSLYGERLSIADIPAGVDVFSAEFHCAEQLGRKLDERKFDLVISGGWPFFCVGALARRYGVPSLFIDAGAVPHDGLAPAAENLQRAVRRLRALALPDFTQVSPISDFIARSQTQAERRIGHFDAVIKLGVDHVERHPAPATPEQHQREAVLLARLKEEKRAGRFFALHLGRFESDGYKNSPAALSIAAAPALKNIDFRLVILDDRENAPIAPNDGRRAVFAGRVSDQMLRDLMDICDVAISVSQWEGFNLPIGEMQRLGKPALAFAIGAHPEVIAHPWFLSTSPQELATKLVACLRGAAPSPAMNALATWRNREEFLWTYANRSYLRVIQNVINSSVAETTPRPVVFFDVTNSSTDPANSGVTRVTRRLISEWRALKTVDMIFVVWDRECQRFRPIRHEEAGRLSAYSGPATVFADFGDGNPDSADLEAHWAALSRQSWFFLAEIPMDGQAAERIQWARAHGLSCAAILYDLIPINHPEYCDPNIASIFPDYIKALGQTDVISAISQSSIDEYNHYTTISGIECQAQKTVTWLPGQFANTKKLNSDNLNDYSAPDEISILCVSTLEPRKNHVRLLAAYAKLRARQPRLRLKLHLVGNRYAGAPDVAAAVEQAIQNDATIEWSGFVSDETVLDLYRRARFSIYPSLVEGFGLPILESLWLATPCLCHSSGVMAELAAEGGCLTVDMTDVDAIADAIERLATDDGLINVIQNEAMGRPIGVWRSYAIEINRTLFPQSDIYMDAGTLETEASELRSQLAMETIAVQSLLAELNSNNHAENIDRSGANELSQVLCHEDRGLKSVLKQYLRERMMKPDIIGHGISQIAKLRRRISTTR